LLTHEYLLRSIQQSNTLSGDGEHREVNGFHMSGLADEPASERLASSEGRIEGRVGFGGIIQGLMRSRLMAIACLVLLTGAGWVYLGSMLAAHARGGGIGQFGPGMGLIELLTRGDRGALAQALFEALCRPGFGRIAMSSNGEIADLAAVFTMWIAMTLAMMLPTAGPMILTYAEIADTAAKKKVPIASPLLLIAGYASIWVGFAAAVTALQFALARAALLDATLGAVSPLFSGAIFLAAGVYQFSPLKNVCVTRCQRPFPFLFSRWPAGARGVFRLGLTQGIFCLGCCWAMMLVMFAVGVMNVIWMAGLGAIMTVEKMATTLKFSRLVGAVVAVIGLALIVGSVAQHWPKGFS
jgi:predicted metal-binding membrane protein